MKFSLRKYKVLAFLLSIILHGCFFLIFWMNRTTVRPVAFQSNFFQGHSVNIQLRPKEKKQHKKRKNPVHATSKLISSKNKLSEDQASGVKTKASRPKHKIVVLYPWAAKKRGLSGTFLADISIDRNGTVQSITTTKSTGFKILDKSASAAIQNAEFLPEINADGLKVESILELSIEFKLDATKSGQSPIQ